MTFEEVAAIVARITYKPNTSIEAYVSPEPQVRVSFFVVNIRGAHIYDGLDPRIHISISYPFFPSQLDSTHQVLRFVYNCVECTERHEMDEWFKVDGIALYDPHKEAK